MEIEKANGAWGFVSLSLLTYVESISEDAAGFGRLGIMSLLELKSQCSSS